MLHEDQLYIIDFQDARMGPDTYDLASLLRDSYVDLPGPHRGRAARVLPGAGRGGPARSTSSASASTGWRSSAT
jgi:hypothetical protein